MTMWKRPGDDGDDDDGESTENSKSKETWGPKLTTV